MELILALTVGMVVFVVTWALWLPPFTALLVFVGVILIGLIVRFLKPSSA